VQYTPVVSATLIAGMFGSLGYILWFAFVKCEKVERERLLLAMVLVLGAVVFWALFEQAGSSLNLFAATNVNLTLLSHPRAVARRRGGAGRARATGGGGDRPGRQAVGQHLVQRRPDPGHQRRLDPDLRSGVRRPVDGPGRRGRNPGPMVKFGLSLIQVGAGFLILLVGAHFADGAFRMPLIFLIVMYMLHTSGEMFMSPVGLSQMTKLSPLSIVSFVMAVWYMALAMGNLFGGWIAGIASTETIGGQVLDPAAAMAQSLLVFKIIGLISIGIGVLFLALSPVLKKWSHGSDDTNPEPRRARLDRP
jgi:POT family proton-dependent oligopeptide transporter